VTGTDLALRGNAPWQRAALLMPLAYLMAIAIAFALGVRNRGGVPSDETIFTFVFAPFALVGGVVASRHPSNPVGWLLGAVALVAGLGYLADEYAIYGLVTAPGSVPAAGFALWYSFAGWMGVLLALLFSVLLFPTGRLPSPRWRPVAWFSAVVMTVVGVIFAFEPTTHPRYPEIVNPAGQEWLRPIAEPLEESFWVYLLLLGVAVASVVARVRRARGVERQQLKWAAVGFAFAALTLAASNYLAGWVSDFGWVVGVGAIPVSIGIAILRYRLYEIDVLINRTLVYGALSAVLILIYAGAVVALQLALSAFTAGSQFAIAGSTLAVVALVQPLRRRIQETVDRRFYRRRYDAQRTLERFGVRLRDELDLDALSAELVAVVRETVQPAHTSLWLLEGSRRAR
jgi:hypothetical protein